MCNCSGRVITKKFVYKSEKSLRHKTNKCQNKNGGPLNKLKVWRKFWKKILRLVKHVLGRLQ